ncbi:MAG: ABC transporter permease [Candidatus Stahlbacteria bacterium]|nr:MAG: ABC transporter permease [Candidatus Stahlbacteria bacterium]
MGGNEKNRMRVSRVTKDVIPPILVCIAVLGLWELIVRVAHVPNYLLPAPSQIFAEIVKTILPLLKDTAVTMLESVLGFIVGSGLAVGVSVIFTHSKLMERSFYPYAIALKTIPIIAIAPLLILWFGNGIPAKVVMAALICFFPVIVNTTKGLQSVSPAALDLFGSLSASRWQVLWKLRFPMALPYIFSALKISATLAVIGAIVGEMAGANIGLGYTILIASYYIDTNMLFAAIVLASLVGVAFFGLVALIEKRALYWHDATLA